MRPGTRVRYIHEDAEYDKRMGLSPPIGTLGTVKDVAECVLHRGSFEQILVAWDSGTINPGTWWCCKDQVELVEGEE